MPPKIVYIVHGDPDAAEAFAGRIRSDLKMEAVVAEDAQTVSAPPDGAQGAGAVGDRAAR